MSVNIIYPYELKINVISNRFKNSNLRCAELKKELEQLANSLNDNPVLMLVKLKK